MADQFSVMDSWTSEQVAEFKQQARLTDFEKSRPLALARAAAAPQRLVAEGDSWFNYLPGTDIIDPNNDWVNELHLRNSAFARVAQRINEVILSL